MSTASAATGFSFDHLRQRHAGLWQAYIEHEFVCRLGKASLPEASFRHYLQQDYRFLIHFARAWGLAVYKSPDLFELRRAFDALKAIVDTELELHVGFCRQWGISEQALAELEEARETLAYTRFVLDCGHRGDLLDLHVALAPCLIGYGEIANRLLARSTTVLEGNPYREWIEMYAGEDFQSAMHDELAWLDRALAGVSRERFEQLAALFRDATRLEIDFWQMGLNAA
ncbi:thiaminase/transcriptional activator TenA [Kushneria sinocarnis]|uniref:Aminopyrimidine aminohydrolase n=1 Tax=Kushneria sinocarnis TaxID=595502 RepID=A0A420WX31_9GAMM|nr:thiaminase II [Kushneria sinocarnis]RKR04290.1 thiaminase/transcriptional activator TenA [Kushneria sinocarnis]